MSVNESDALLPPTVNGHIDEIVGLAEVLAVDHRGGTPPERMVTSVVGIRDYVFRFLGHYEERVKSPQPRQKTNPVGFQAPAHSDRTSMRNDHRD